MENPKTIIDAIELFKLHLRLLGVDSPTKIGFTPPCYELFTRELIEKSTYNFNFISQDMHRLTFSGISFDAVYREESEKRRQIVSTSLDKMIEELKEIKKVIKKI